MEPTGNSQSCSRCGGTLEFKTTIENPMTGSPVHFFRCEDCGHVHSVERRTKGALSS
jgi:transposase